MLRIKTILHPTDFSEQANHVFQVACSLARGFKAQLLVLHVAMPPVCVSGEGLVILPPENYEDPMRQKLDEIIPPDPRVRIERCFVQGDPVTEILRKATDSHCDLILMGTHGRAGLGRLLMGSVAEQVVRKAPCPVLTLRVPFPQESKSNEHADVALAGSFGLSAN